MSLFPHLTTVFLETIIARLAPWFLAAAGGDHTLARETAQALLASFDAQTEEEVRLAAEIASYGFGALEALSKSADPDLPLNTVLRLRGSANTLQRSKNQCQRTLDTLRRERRAADAPVAEASPKIAEAGPKVAEAGPKTAECAAPAATPAILPHVETVLSLPEPATTLSRQQRRALQRAADKAQRRQVERARRDAARAARVAPRVAAPGNAHHPAIHREANHKAADMAAG